MTISENESKQEKGVNDKNQLYSTLVQNDINFIQLKTTINKSYETFIII